MEIHRAKLHGVLPDGLRADYCVPIFVKAKNDARPRRCPEHSALGCIPVCRPISDAQQPAGIAAEYLLAVFGIKLGILYEVDRLAVGLERPIDREQDSPDAHFRDRASQ